MSYFIAVLMGIFGAMAGSVGISFLITYDEQSSEVRDIGMRVFKWLLLVFGLLQIPVIFISCYEILQTVELSEPIQLLINLMQFMFFFSLALIAAFIVFSAYGTVDQIIHLLTKDD